MQNVHTHSGLPVGKFAHPPKNVRAFGIQHGMRVADFGSGSGVYTLAIAALLEGSGKVYAVDVQRDLLRRLTNEARRRGYENVEVVWADLETPRASKLADASIDLILVSNILFQVPEKLPVLREARRIVKPTGKVVVIDWSDSFRGMGPAKEDFIKKETVLECATKAGLALDREFEAGAHHYGLIFRGAPLSS